MAYNLVLSLPTPADVPADGWMVGYKPLGDPGAYTVAGPFMSMPITIDTGEPVGTLFEGYITRDCGITESTQFFWQTPCNCVGAGYALAPSGSECQATDTVAPTVTNSGYCLAPSRNTVYTQYKSRIYNPGFVAADLNSFVDTANVFASMTTAVQWANIAGNLTDGPLNREGVWVDNDCNGSVDTDAVTATIACTYNNATTSDKTIHIGVGADNSFILSVNGTEIVDSGIGGDLQFKMWHILPVTVVPGVNYINVVSTNGGGPQSVGLVIYDNTAAQIAAAATDAVLTIPFATHMLIGTTFDVATCPANYSLDVSGGAGNYTCTRTQYKACNTAT